MLLQKNMLEDNYIKTIRDFIDFINLQVGMYTDACAGFQKNKTLIERQISRVTRRSGFSRDKDGKRVMMMTSMEDPLEPDVIHYRIMRAEDYVASNDHDGENEQQHSRAILVFIFSFWEEEIRPRLASGKGIDLTDITSDIMGDLRILRHAILHAKSILRKDEFNRLKKVSDLFEQDSAIILSHAKMHRIFVLVKQDLVRMINDHWGIDSSQVNPEDVKSVAIQRVSRN